MRAVLSPSPDMSLIYTKLYAVHSFDIQLNNIASNEFVFSFSWIMLLVMHL